MADGSLGKVPKFLKRLFREASDPSNPNIVWSENGRNLKIPNKESFVRETLPRLSRTKEYSAFIRQLNNYGFMKVRNDDTEEEYQNNFFVENQPLLMALIKRVKHPKRQGSQIQIHSIEKNIVYLTESNFRLTREVEALREHVERQERTIDGLLNIFSRVFRNGLQTVNYEAGQDEIRIDPKYAIDQERLIEKKDLSGSLVSSKHGERNRDGDFESTEDGKVDMFKDMNSIFF